MDIHRPQLKKKKIRRRVLVVVGSGIVLGIILLVIGRIETGIPSLRGASVWIGTVQRGALEFDVSGSGTLEPEDQRLITAQTAGRVERITMYPGAEVHAESLILVLNNPRLRQEADTAWFQLKDAETQLEIDRVQMKDRMLDMAADQAKLCANCDQVRLEAGLNQTLFNEGLISELNYRQSQLNATQLVERVEMGRQRLEFQKEIQAAEIRAHQARIELLTAQHRLLTNQVATLEVRPAMAGVLQQLYVETGQQITEGTVLAEVADPSRLMAVVQVPESQARQIQVGQPALVDTRHGEVEGAVRRIDPTVVQGTVTVEIRLTGEMPAGARPAQSIVCTIVTASIPDTVYVKRPAMARENSEIMVFRLDPSGRYGSRVHLLTGKGSVDCIEVLEGLNPGDRIILSGTEDVNDAERIRIKR